MKHSSSQRQHDDLRLPLFNRPEKFRLLRDAVAQVRFSRGGHDKAVFQLLELVELKTQRDDLCHLHQKTMAELLGWGTDKLKEVRDAAAAQGWIELVPVCPTCGDRRHVATRIVWARVAAAAKKGTPRGRPDSGPDRPDSGPDRPDRGPENPDRGPENPDRHNKEFNTSKVNELITQSPQPERALEGFEACASGVRFRIPTDESKALSVPADKQRRLLADPRFVQRLWFAVRELPDVRDEEQLGVFAAAAHAGRFDARGKPIPNPAGLFKVFVDRRAWRLPPGDRGGIPNRAEDVARRMLRDLDGRRRLPAVAVDRDAEAAAAREAQVREARKLVERSAAVLGIERSDRAREGGAPARRGS